MTKTSKSAPNYLKIVVESSFSELETVVDQAHDFCMSCSSGEELVHKVMLLTSEAVTNAIKHGNRLADGKTVVVEFISKDSEVEVWVQDEGEGFVRGEIPDPLAEEHLLDPGGRGIFLIERIADEVRYELGGRRVGMIFRASS